MNLADRIEAFAKLGDELKGEKLESSGIREVVKEAEENNRWFTPQSINFALEETIRLLGRSSLEKWLSAYPGFQFDPPVPKEVGVILAGNIPMVGFHDFLSVLLSGNCFKGKLSGKDDKLLPWLAGRLKSILPGLGERIRFVEDKLGSVDAIIATGSNNTSRYFQYYFGRYPHIFRKNRNGIAVLTGNETDEELALLADDIFIYFGLGCRSVSKMYVPAGYDFDKFYRTMEKYHPVANHNKYANNYQYYRSVYLMNLVEHLDNGFLILKKDKGFSSPVSTLFYDHYDDLEDVKRQIKENKEKIQCVVAAPGTDLPAIPFGQSQHPEAWDYADNMDTIKFLHNLYKN